MLEFYASTFAGVVNNLGRLVALIDARDRVADWPAVEADLREALGLLVRHFVSLPISPTLRRHIRDLADTKGRLLSGDLAKNAATNEALATIQLDLLHELSEHRFYLVPAELAFLLGEEAPINPDVSSKFLEATKDIAAAGRCLALDEWTACVFHCMRVLEHGLRALATDVGVVMKVPIELQNWQTIIDLIEARIRDLEGLPKGSEKSERLRFYGEAASQFRYFKNAWRNHVSHSRTSYDSREAKRVWRHTMEFMQTVAGNIGTRDDAK